MRRIIVRTSVRSMSSDPRRTALHCLTSVCSLTLDRTKARQPP
jgi:hypothetical protein